MSDAAWSARRKNKTNTTEQLKKIKLNTDDAGQYQHNDVIKFIEQLKQVAKEQFNPLDKTNGMSKLFEQNRNTINAITTQDAYNYKDILKNQETRRSSHPQKKPQ
jgi:hypothetical protein